MRPDHAALVANAVRDHLWSGLRICAANGEGGWKDVRGDVKPEAAEQTFEGMDTRFGQTIDVLHLDALDFAPTTTVPLPGPEAWVRFTDVRGVVRIKRLALAPGVRANGGRFLIAPLKEPDRSATVPA